MENAPTETQSPDLSFGRAGAVERHANVLVLGLAGVLFLIAAVAQFGIGPAVSPGFTYLAVVLTLAAIGALLAAGLEA